MLMSHWIIIFKRQRIPQHSSPSRPYAGASYQPVWWGGSPEGRGAPEEGRPGGKVAPEEGRPGGREARRKGGPGGGSCYAHRVEEQLIPVLARDGDEPVVQQRAVLDFDFGLVHHLAAAGGLLAGSGGLGVILQGRRGGGAWRRRSRSGKRREEASKLRPANQNITNTPTQKCSCRKFPEARLTLENPPMVLASYNQNLRTHDKFTLSGYEFYGPETHAPTHSPMRCSC